MQNTQGLRDYLIADSSSGDEQNMTDKTNQMPQKIKEGWNNNIPPILMITQETPGAISLPLSGSGTSRAPLHRFLMYLEDDIAKKKGKYFAYVDDGCREEADTYTLDGWQVLYPDDGTYEAIVILYYSPMNERATLAKWMPQFLED